MCSFGSKVPLGVFQRKNGIFGELGHLGFLALLVVDKASYMLVTVKKDVFGGDSVLEFCGGTYPEV